MTKPEPIGECDALRRLDSITAVDPRYAARVVIEPKVGARPMNIEDHWNDIEAMALHEGVPGVIRVHFETARNLVLYSWFAYRFQQVAEMHAYASVEYALRLRARLPVRSSGWDLRRLLHRAVREGWIRDEGFRHVRLMAERRAEFERRGQEPEPPAAPEAQRFARIISDTLPFIRNKLAHGSAMLSGNAKSALAICSDIINQLFPSA
jgi:hypothetical protein